MKATAKNLQDAMEMALRDVKGDPNTDWYYTSDTALEAYPGKGKPGVKFNIVQGTADIRESFILHLSIILSGESYGIGNHDFPTMIEVRDMLDIRKRLLQMSTVHDNDTFDIWIDELS